MEFSEFIASILDIIKAIIFIIGIFMFYDWITRDKQHTSPNNRRTPDKPIIPNSNQSSLSYGSSVKVKYDPDGLNSRYRVVHKNQNSDSLFRVVHRDHNSNPLYRVELRDPLESIHFSNNNHVPLDFQINRPSINQDNLADMMFWYQLINNNQEDDDIPDDDDGIPDYYD